MKTNFSRFGRSAVSVVLSAIMLLSTVIVNAETINVDSVSEAAASDTVTVDITPDDVTQTVMDVEDVRANSEDDSAAAESVKKDEEESQPDAAEVKTEDVKADTAVQANSKKSEVKKTPEASGVGKGDTIYFIDTDYTSFGSVYIYLIADNSFHEMARVRKGSNIYYYTLTANYTNNSKNFLFVNKNSWTGQKQTEDVKFSTSNNVYYPTTNSGNRNVASTNFDTLGFSVGDYDNTAKFYYKNQYDWSYPTLYAWYETKIGNVPIQIKSTGYWPGTRMDKTLEDGVYSAVVPTKINKLIVNDGIGEYQTTTVTATSSNINAQYTQMLNNADLDGQGTSYNWENHRTLAETTELTVILKDGTLRSATSYEKYSNFADSIFREIDGVARNGSKIGNVTISVGYDSQAEVAVIPRGSTIKFRTKIDGNEDASGARHCDKYYVKAFDVNGETIFPTKEGSDTYVGEYTIPNDLEVSKLEITPIYFYNEGYDRNREFITFIVENFDGDVKSEWGKKVDNTEGTPILACYAWYDHQVKDGDGNVIFDPDKVSADHKQKSALGGYPGQPMVYEDGHYIMQVPVTDDYGSHIQGITLNNYVWDRVHCQALGAYSDTQREWINCQTYDADDFVVLSNATPAPEFIAMRFKYRTNKNPHEGTAVYDARYSGNKPADDDASTLTLTHYDSTNGNGWDDYLDYNGRTIDLFNYVLSGDEASSAPFYIVSDGYQEIYYGHFGTIWYIYDSNRKFVGKLPSSALLYTPTDEYGNALDLYTVMGSARKDSVPGWFLPFYSNTEYNPTISSTDRDTARTSYWETYYDLYKGNNTVPAKKHPAKITFETAIRAKDSGTNSHVIDPALRNDVRWFYSRVSAINAEIKIEYTTTSDSPAFIPDSFNTTATDATAPYAGTATNAHAYFTNTSVSQLNSTTGEYETVSIANEYEVTGVQSSTDSVKDRFTFEADSMSDGTVTIDGQTVNKTFLFEGWYRVVDGVYSKLTSEEKIDAESAKTLLESSVDMRNSVTLVARYVPLSGDELIITHDLYKNADKYTNSPAVLNGTGTPKVSVYVVDENNNNKTIKIPYSKLNYNQVAIDKTTLQLYQAQGYKLVVTLDVESDSDNTYETTYLKTLAEDAPAGTDDKGYYYPYDYKVNGVNHSVTGPAGAGTWNAAKTADTAEGNDQVVYTTAISDLLQTITSGETTTTNLKTNNIKFYTQLSTTTINVVLKYYDRQVSNSTPLDIDTTATEITKTVSVNGKTLEEAVGTATADLISNKKIDNDIDEYTFWASLSEASGTNGIAKLSRPNGSGTYSESIYHTDYYARQPGEGYFDDKDHEDYNAKWVTYLDANGVEIKTAEFNKDTDTVATYAETYDENAQTNIKRVSKVVVWGYNAPKTYTMTFNTENVEYDTDAELYLATGVKSNFNGMKFYYNERVGELKDSTSNSSTELVDQVSDHLAAYGISQKPDATKVYANTEVTVSGSAKVFDGWYELVNGNYVKVSSDPVYGNRVTKSATLYAGYKDNSTTVNKGITVTANDVEKYVVGDTDYIRYTTVLNSYGFDDSDPNFKSASVVYVRLGEDVNYSDTVDTLLGYNVSNGSGTLKQTIIDQLKEDKSTERKVIAVTITGLDPNAKTVIYSYDVYPTYTDGKVSTPTPGSIQFTNKNRTQFSMNLPVSEVTGESGSCTNLVVFAAVKYEDSTVYQTKEAIPYNYFDLDQQSTTTTDPDTGESVTTTTTRYYIASDNYIIYQNGAAVNNNN